MAKEANGTVTIRISLNASIRTTTKEPPRERREAKVLARAKHLSAPAISLLSLRAFLVIRLLAKMGLAAVSTSTWAAASLNAPMVLARKGIMIVSSVVARIMAYPSAR